MKTIELDISGTIDRPVTEVAAQFADITYHATRPIHRGVKYTIHEVTPQKNRFRVELRFLGIWQTDEVVNSVLSPNQMRYDFVDGTNKGMKIDFRFTPTKNNSTQVDVHYSFPVSGIKVLLKPVLKLAIRQIALKALEEETRDLEGLRYSHYQSGTS